MTQLMDTVRFRDLGITSGRGACLLNDKDNRFYIDFFCDVGTASLGYGSDEMHNALANVAANGIVHSPILFKHDVRELAAKRLCDATDMDKVFFCNSGAEAVEAAIKIARKEYAANYNNKLVVDGVQPVIYTQVGSFHGRTLAGIAAGNGPAYHREGFGPLPSGFAHFQHWSEVPHSAAAIMISPVFGNNDVRPAFGTSWPGGIDELRQLRKYCDDHRITLIFDEVQSGGGRTGDITYAKRIGVQPDILTLGKGIAMGAPVGATLARGKFAHTIKPGMHFSTFGGNPLCCHFLLTMLEWLDNRENLLNVDKLGQRIATVLVEHPQVTSVRAIGALVAADVNVDTLKLAQGCEDVGLLLGAFRQGPGPLKITPPLNITQSELTWGLKTLLDQLTQATPCD